ncbi:hypothetical protein [Xenorhabdus sp. KJ12.1]|uniref:hypothetical protein n=1 Tax=Xenorhabdus sp. KJ12.1 TaxID=1851571 RepID=UPI000C057B11|nr:hypothetical protein [Xenorhabdus sp. KJ12.1]PHM66418.1 hypothetical protein Xekj_04125 [Xenorhabdus sp. KJ12.1]
MIIISHRGYWIKDSEKNTLIAFERAFSLGYGIEIDIRDFNEDLVISHDIATKESLRFDVFLESYKKYRIQNLLAFNIKSDGLQSKIKQYLYDYKISNYFLFDMSIPDTLGYLSAGMNTYIRVSKYEVINGLYKYAKGIWLDGFKETMVNESLIKKVIEDGKKVCIVSSELHKLNYIKQWEGIKFLESDILNSSNVILCTDFPEKASEFFL